MRTSNQLYEAYVVMRSQEQAVRDVCIARGMTAEEIEINDAYCDALEARKRAYDAWVNAWKGCGYA